MTRGLLFATTFAIAALALAPAALAAPCQPYWTQVSSPGYATEEDQILDLAVLSDSDIWAAGMSDHGGFVQHWDGTSWGTALGPKASDYYYGIAALGSDVWVAGFQYDNATGFQKSLIKHWDGVSWSTVPTPSVPGSEDNSLSGVVALSPTDAWAVGYYTDPTLDSFTAQPLILHWNGAAWSISPTPDLSLNANVFLEAVTASGPGDVWALGRYRNPVSGAEEALALRWDGFDWNLESTDNPNPDRQVFSSGAAVSAADIWAVGYQGDFPLDPVIQHSSGAGFTTVPSPSFTNSAELGGVAAVGDEDVWAVGSVASGTGRTLIEHWDGSSWTVFPSPQIAGQLEVLRAVATTPGGNVWAAGARNTYLGTLVERLCPIKVRDFGYTPTHETVPQGSGVAWSFPSYNVGDHSVTDASGMSLFDSGATPAGGSFTFVLDAAGTYPVMDTESSNTSDVAVPLLADPASGLRAALTWSAAPPPGGFVFDVQVRRPGTSGFVPWRTGVTTRSGLYVAPSAGTYRFRARLRLPGTASSDWSPVRVVSIS